MFILSHMRPDNLCFLRVFQQPVVFSSPCSKHSHPVVCPSPNESGTASADRDRDRDIDIDIDIDMDMDIDINRARDRVRDRAEDRDRMYIVSRCMEARYVDISAEQLSK